jgi:glycosyltransferase involved in cell wall biosynthesis
VSVSVPISRVLVVLPHHLDVTAWSARFARKETPDQTPYGYHFANLHGCHVTFSKPTVGTGWVHFMDRVARKILGFDLRHIWANRQLIASKQFDCIWTHTEYEHLGIGLLKKVLKKPIAPLIAQSVWLMDEWANYWVLRKNFYRWLMVDFEVATFLSPLNTQRAQQLQLARQVRLVPFGISLEDFSPASPPDLAEQPQRPVRVLALGNDRHRDWSVLVQALGGRAQYEVRVGSSSFPAHLLSDTKHRNIKVGPMTQAQVIQAYAWADCVVLPLKRNLHASGLTAMLESVAMMTPLVCTQVGGLEAYFDTTMVSYCAAQQADALRSAVDSLMAQAASDRYSKAHKAKRHLLDQKFTSEGFAQRHVQLSQELAKT